jgi:hypothetical protein
MTHKSISLAGAGLSLALALAASPAASQDYGHSPQYSTPEEQARTQQLNEQYAHGTYQSPDDLNNAGGFAPSQLRTEPVQYGNPDYRDQQQSDEDPQQRYDDQQQQYDQQRQQYDDQQQRYQEQRDQYRAQRHQYIHDLRRYDLARYEWTDYPRVYVYRYEGPHLQRLYLIADPTHQLWSVPVEGPSGRYIGKVRNVETAPDGRPARVEIALNRMVSVWVRPDHFRYDPYEHVLFTDLTRDDLWDMPGATVESGTYRP